MAKDKEISAKGIILETHPQGEYGRRCVVLTDRLGKITAFSGGAARPASGVTGSLRPFTAAEFTLARGRSAWNLRSISIIDAFADLPLDPEKYMAASYVLELASWQSAEGMDESEAKNLLNLIYVTFEALRASCPSELVLCIYELRILLIQGEYCVSPGDISDLADAGTADRVRRLWDTVLGSPLSKLYISAEETDSTAASVFADAEHRLFVKQVPHRFRSLAMYEQTVR